MNPEAVAEILNRFPEVAWDRTAGEDDERAVYGWLPRPDGRADFLLLWFWEDAGKLQVSHATSSTELSPIVGGRLYGKAADDYPHHECEPVRQVFGDLVRRVAPTGPNLDPKVLGQ